MKPKVIVVDDDFDAVEVLSEFLRLKDFEVIGSAYDGKKAVELYENLKPDVVILDVQMPFYDGYYGLEKMREIDPLAKIIMVTTDNTEHSKVHLRNLGATSVVSKPHEMDSLIEILDKISEENVIYPNTEI